MAEVPAAAPRLLALRLRGFKSFADRTIVEFGSGISAIVGPNGSGKSNLADALRWALGEQGRALRSRKSEDVIFAGSDRRAALGMADVSIVLDNSDSLVPVDYRVLELGRRLYRSGENDYLLNRQRVRLKDLVDLLDSAHLADNAFLFIGQGMVDQALSLRPEERRPLFEEVAGVRRHERRRHRAEEQLLEAEVNLARVEDILGELRPQARRLAAQAEQQATRESAGEELAAGLVLTAHARWNDVASRRNDAAARLASARTETERTLGMLAERERAVAALRSQLADRAAEERLRRGRLDDAQERLTRGRIRAAHLGSELAALDREAERLGAEHTSATADLERQRRLLAVPLPERDHGLESALGDAERRLAEALEELAAMRSTRDARGEAARAAQRAEATRQAELETGRRRLADAASGAARERTAAETASARVVEYEARLEDARLALATAATAERSAADRRGPAVAALEAAVAAERSAGERAAHAAARAAGLRGQLDALAARRAEDESRGLARRARKAGGRRIDDGLRIDPDFRSAVEAALGEAVGAYIVPPDALTDLAGERGIAAVDATRATRPTGGAAADRPTRLLDRVAELRGGRLGDAVQHDPVGAVARIVARAVWLPDLAGLIAIQPDLPPGWIAVTRDGAATGESIVVRFGRPAGTLERAADSERLTAELEVLEAEARVAAEATVESSRTVARLREELRTATGAEAEAIEDRRRAEALERAAGRELEAAAREAAWHGAQAERHGTEVRRLETALEALAASAPQPADGRTGVADESGTEQASAIEVWEARVAEVRARRDTVAAEVAVAERARRDAEAVRAAAEASARIDEERLRRADGDLATLDERRRSLAAEDATSTAELALAQADEADARQHLGALVESDAADRAQVAQLEAAVGEARDRVRAAEDRTRAAESADIHARVELDLVREQVLAELAGLGELGLAALAVVLGDSDAATRSGARADGPATPGEESAIDDADAAQAVALEAALDRAADRWVAFPPAGPPPAPGRLASLRRRYHELGAGNPLAVQEYAEVRSRLETLETQERDLRDAIAGTRTLIAELSTLIADRFRTTFAALEGAFDRRFRQLFGGGQARLSLTDPDDLSATGVEIVARPPGKKLQALAMLSGGERALTAVALLFAMLEVRPVPFCVLDEVDAALDEANVGRFNDALRGLAGTIQFVVITHNRSTIEAADALYGVTVGDDSVSRVISLRLDEATAIATQASNGQASAAAAVPVPAARN